MSCFVIIQYTCIRVYTRVITPGEYAFCTCSSIQSEHDASDGCCVRCAVSLSSPFLDSGTIHTYMYIHCTCS